MISTQARTAEMMTAFGDIALTALEFLRESQRRRRSR